MVAEGVPQRAVDAIGLLGRLLGELDPLRPQLLVGGPAVIGREDRGGAEGALRHEVAELGGGVVVGEDGTVYASSCAPGYITAISADGSQVLWEHAATGDINGTPALGNDNAVYYNDCSAGNLVKLDAETGEQLVSFHLADNLNSSPTIGPDGVIYCNGVLNGKPTLFAVDATSTAPADSWSQMAGSPSKSACLY